MTTDVVEKSDLTETQARALTEKIRKAAEAMWTQVLYAYKCRIWLAYGYSTWADYLAIEFDMSRSRGYQLLDQANVTLALAAAAEVEPETVNLSAAEVKAIKPDLPAVVDKVREATTGQSKTTRSKTVKNVATEERKGVKVQRVGRVTQGQREKVTESSDVIDAVAYEPAAALRIAELESEVVRLKAEIKRLEAELAKRPKDGILSSLPLPKTGKKAPQSPPKDCVHPITRRIGTMCALCGKEKV